MCVRIHQQHKGQQQQYTKLQLRLTNYHTTTTTNDMKPFLSPEQTIVIYVYYTKKNSHVRITIMNRMMLYSTYISIYNYETLKHTINI